MSMPGSRLDNPAGLLFLYIVMWLCKRQPPAPYKALQEGWEAIKVEFFEKLIKSMHKRVQAVCKAKGWYTKY